MIPLGYGSGLSLSLQAGVLAGGGSPSVFDGGTWKLYTLAASADAGDLLGTGTIPTPAFGPVDVDGVRALVGTWQLTAVLNGDAAGLLLTGTGGEKAWLTVTESGGGGDVIIDHKDVQISDVLALTALDWTNGYATPNIFDDDLVGVTIDAGSGEFRRAGVSIGLYTPYNSLVPTYLYVEDDPGGQGGNRVFTLDFQGMLDARCNLQSPATAAFGSEWFARGYFYFTHADWNDAGGKLEQLLTAFSGGIQIVFYFSAGGGATTPVGVQLVMNDGTVHYEQTIGPSIAAATRYYFERRVKINSGYGVADGEFELWFDDPDTPVLSLTNVPWYKANNGKTVDIDLGFGSQLNTAVGSSRKRYWSQIAASTQRIGP